MEQGGLERLPGTFVDIDELSVLLYFLEPWV